MLHYSIITRRGQRTEKYEIWASPLTRFDAYPQNTILDRNLISHMTRPMSKHLVTVVKKNF